MHLLPARWREERERRRLEKISKPSYRPAQVALILDELRRRTEEMSRRSESLSARAGILVASAALIATLQDGRGTGPLVLGAVVLALGAAGAGISAIFPSVIRYPTIRDTRQQIFAKGDVEDGQWWLIDRLTEQYADSAAHVKRRGTLLRLGFILLGLSIVLTAIAVAETAGGGDMSKDDINPASVPDVQPNQGGHSSEYAEHGQSPREGDGIRIHEKGYFGNEGGEKF